MIGDLFNYWGETIMLVSRTSEHYEFLSETGRIYRWHENHHQLLLGSRNFRRIG